MDSLFINLIGEQFGLDLKLGHRVPRGDRSSSQLTVTKLCQLLDWKKTSIIVRKKEKLITLFLSNSWHSGPWLFLEMLLLPLRRF